MISEGKHSRFKEVEYEGPTVGLHFILVFVIIGILAQLNEFLFMVYGKCHLSYALPRCKFTLCPNRNPPSTGPPTIKHQHHYVM